MKKEAAYPYLLWMVVFTIIPLMLVVMYSVNNPDGSLTLSHFQRVFEPMYAEIMWRSIVVAFVSTVVCFLIGYPVAYILSRDEFSNRGTLLFLFLVPMWMNFLLRTYSWMTILEKNGIINSILGLFGIEPIKMIYTNGAIILGMVYNFLPFMILPIYTVLKKMDHSILEAAEDLGANSFNVFFRIVFPLSIPGIISGVTMVFMPAVTTFIVPNLLGGGKQMYIGSLIEQQFLRIGDWNFGSAVSVILMIIILISMALFTFVDKEEEGGGLF